MREIHERPSLLEVRVLLGPLVVYNYFFAETGQSKTHQCDIMLHAVRKMGTCVLSVHKALPLTPESLPQ